MKKCTHCLKMTDKYYKWDVCKECFEELEEFFKPSRKEYEKMFKESVELADYLEGRKQDDE